MNPDNVKKYYSQPEVVQHYIDATLDIGLWQSEEKVFRQFLDISDTILDLGTGSGRIPIGLYELGYQQVIGIDNALPMIKAARHLTRRLEYAVAFQTSDATNLSFGEAIFEGVIFGYNGLMHIPTAARRRKALAEIYKTLKPGRAFIFTTQDRDLPAYRAYFKDAFALGENHPNDTSLEYGDISLKTPYGTVYLHVPKSEEIDEILKQTGFQVVSSDLRSAIAKESQLVCDFADECRFWVARKPG